MHLFFPFKHFTLLFKSLPSSFVLLYIPVRNKSIKISWAFLFTNYVTYSLLLAIAGHFKPKAKNSRNKYQSLAFTKTQNKNLFFKKSDSK